MHRECAIALDSEKYNWPHNAYIGEAVPIDRTCVVVMVLSR